MNEQNCTNYSLFSGYAGESAEVNKSQLIAVLAEIVGMDSALYTDESCAALAEAVGRAEAIPADNNATQNAVNEANARDRVKVLRPIRECA